MNLHEIITALCVVIIFFMIFVNGREDDVEEIYDIPPKDPIVSPLAWLVERVEYNNGVIEYRIYNKGRGVENQKLFQEHEDYLNRTLSRCKSDLEALSALVTAQQNYKDSLIKSKTILK